MFSEKIAINNMYACNTIVAVEEQYKKSCDICCNSPQCLWRNWDGCKVAMTHDIIIRELKKNIVTNED